MPLKKPPFGGPWSLNTSPYTSISHQEPGHHTRCDHTQCNGRSEWQGQGLGWDFLGQVSSPTLGWNMFVGLFESVHEAISFTDITQRNVYGYFWQTRISASKHFTSEGSIMREYQTLESRERGRYEAIKKLSCLRPLRIFDPLRIRASKKDSVVVSEFLKFSSHLRHLLVVLDFQDWYLTSCEMRAQISGKHLTKKKKTWAGTKQVSVCFHIIFIHTVHWWDLCINTVNQKE